MVEKKPSIAAHPAAGRTCGEQRWRQSGDPSLLPPPALSRLAAARARRQSAVGEELLACGADEGEDAFGSAADAALNLVHGARGPGRIVALPREAQRTCGFQHHLKSGGGSGRRNRGGRSRSGNARQRVDVGIVLEGGEGLDDLDEVRAQFIHRIRHVMEDERGIFAGDSFLHACYGPTFQHGVAGGPGTGCDTGDSNGPWDSCHWRFDMATLKANNTMSGTTKWSPWKDAFEFAVEETVTDWQWGHVLHEGGCSECHDEGGGGGD